MVQLADTSRTEEVFGNGGTPRENGATGGSAVGGSAVVLRDRFRIYPETPIADMDGPSTKAYMAQDPRDPGRPLFALICPSDLPPRTNLADILKARQIPGVLALIDWGVVDWPPTGGQSMALLYERPLGGRVMEAAAMANRTQKIEDPRTNIVAPLHKAIGKLNQFDIVHRAIRPDNLYYLDVEKTVLVLGDCLAVPPGYDQPIQFETVERGMCARAGRGVGGLSEDMYALGVTLVHLLLGGDPIAGMSPTEIIDGKIRKGSYSLLGGRERFPANMRSLLQGLLADGKEGRWSLEQVGVWLKGGRFPAASVKRVARLEHGFHFGGEEYKDLRALAMAFFRNPEQAAGVIRENRLGHWVRQHLKSPIMADKIDGEMAKHQNYGGDKKYADDVTVARICIILDPEGPIRHKGMAFMPDGFGPMLVREMMAEGTPHALLDSVLHDLQAFKLAAKNASPGQIRHLELMKNWLKSSDMGYGIERCLYETNMTLPCQSKLMEHRYVTTPRELLLALDDISNTKHAEGFPVDRHIAAFVASRMNGKIETHLRSLSSGAHARMLLGMLGILATVQWRVGIQSLYGLASWIGGLLVPALEIYHSSLTRRALEREIPRLVRRGSLSDMVDLIENKEALQSDESEFQAARREYNAVEDEILSLDVAGFKRRQGQEIARQVVAISSILLSFFFVVIVWIARNWNGA